MNPRPVGRLGGSVATPNWDGVTLEVYERWLPIAGWLGWYEVSNRGRVRSVERIVVFRVGAPHRYRSRILKQAPNGDGHLKVTLCRPGVRVSCFVHRLVLEAFDRPCPPGMECLHGPGGPADNRWPENIRWGTPVQNCAERNTALGERHGFAKLTDVIVRECRQRHAQGETTASLAQQFGVAERVMGKAINRESWRHVA